MAALLERFFSETLGLTKIPPYLPTFYWSFLTFLFIHQVVAPYFSARYFPAAYASKRRLARNVWYVISSLNKLQEWGKSYLCIVACFGTIYFGIRNDSKDKYKKPTSPFLAGQYTWFLKSMSSSSSHTLVGVSFTTPLNVR